MRDAIVIDSQGFVVITVLVDNEGSVQNTSFFTFDETIHQLIFEGTDIIQNMDKPRWDGSKWVETGTPPTPPIHPEPPPVDEAYEFLLGLMEGYKNEQ